MACDMLFVMKESNVIIPPEVAVGRLAREHPDWLPVLEAAVAVAANAEAHGGEFAGAWVVDELGRRGAPRWMRNLRFIAAGASTEPPADTARQAGEITYEPRSWR